MNVLIISSPDPFKNAGRVALDLFRGLREKEDLNVNLLVKYSGKRENGIVSYYSKTAYLVRKMFATALSFFQTKKIETDADYYFQDFDQTKSTISSKKILKKTGQSPDVILLLFMQKFISFSNVKALHDITKARIIMYPMDMALYTGGCHYSWNCSAYKASCGKCPALYSDDQYDQSNRNQLFKKQQIADVNLTVLAGNKQMFRQITASSVFRDKKVVGEMYPETDRSIFHRRDVAESRMHFNIPEDKFVFFFGSVGLSEKRKGMQLLNDSLALLRVELIKMKFDLNRILLLVAGGDYDEKNCGFDVKYLGHIADLSLLAKAYCAADFFVCPSVEDAGPTMVLQAIFCNVPVIGFKIGFTEEFISDGQNGFVVSEKSEIALSESLLKAVNMSTQDHTRMKDNLSALVRTISEVSLKDKLAKLIREV